MKNSFDDMAQEDFDKHLREVTCRMDLMDIPGVRELVAEELNNEVLESWAEANGRCIECGAVLDEYEACDQC